MSEFKPYKRGDVREDGKIFWGCNKANREGERWLTPEKFAALKLKTRARNAAIYLNNKEDICAARKVYYNENKERCIKRSSDTYAAICLRIEQDSEFRKEVSAKNSTRFKSGMQLIRCIACGCWYGGVYIKQSPPAGTARIPALLNLLVVIGKPYAGILNLSL